MRIAHRPQKQDRIRYRTVEKVVILSYPIVIRSQRTNTRRIELHMMIDYPQRATAETGKATKTKPEPSFFRLAFMPISSNPPGDSTTTSDFFFGSDTHIRQ